MQQKQPRDVGDAREGTVCTATPAPRRRAHVAAVVATGLALAAGAAASPFDPSRTQSFDQSNFILFGEGVEAGDGFGRSLAAGDFDCDGFDDLAVGVPFEDAQIVLPPDPPIERLDSGVVHVIYGSEDGLVATDNQYFRESDVQGGATENRDRFGEVLASGDFDGDLCDDLAIGVPFEHLGTVGDAGVVYVLYGGPGGLDGGDAQLWHQETAFVIGLAEPDDEFGTSLATGDLNGDGRDELIIGAPAEALDDGGFEGAVWVLRGSVVRLQAVTEPWVQLITQDDPRVADAGEVGDAFGSSLATCDVDGDGFDELYVSSPGESGLFPSSGALHVFFGSSGGHTLEDPDDVLLLGTSSDLFSGDSMAAAFDDPVTGCTVALGQPRHDVPTSAGAVIDGGSLRLTKRLANGTDWGASGFRQDGLAAHYEAGGFDPVEQADRFASVLAYGDFTGNGLGDLAIGTWEEDLGAVDEGLVQILFARTGTPLGSEARSVRQVDVLPGTVVGESKGFGFALATGDFDGDGKDELAVGAPFEEVDGKALAGKVTMMYSAFVLTDGFESGDLSAWSTTTP